MSIQQISTQDALSNCINHIRKSDTLSVDLEFDRNFYRYGFNLCLVQVYSHQTCYLIDPLSSNLDITPLFEIFEDEHFQKIVFSFGEDLRLLHSLGCFPRNIYDISIATSLLNYPQTSLSVLIKTVLGIDTGASSQQSNWYQRPLSENQVHYAAQDVLHLQALWQHFKREAEEKEINEWIEEENLVLALQDFSDNKENYIREKDKKDLSEVEWHLMKELLHFRETTARKFNKPSYQIMGKDRMYQIAKNPALLKNWETLSGIFRGIKNPEYKHLLTNLMEEGQQTAKQLGLSRSEQAKKPLPRNEYERFKKEKGKINRMKSSFFSPIKKSIAKDYGSEAASFMLSNRIISDLVTEKNYSLENYKCRLLEKYAAKLNLDREILLDIVD